MPLYTHRSALWQLHKYSMSLPRQAHFKLSPSVSHLLTTAKLSKWSIHSCQFPQSPLKVSRISSGLEDIVQLCRLRQCNATKFNSTAEFSTATKTTQYRLVNIQKYFSTTAHLEMRSCYVIIT